MIWGWRTQFSPKQESGSETPGGYNCFSLQQSGVSSAKSCENSHWGPPKGPGRLPSQASLKGERGQGGQRLPPSHGDGCGLKEVRLCRQRSRNKTPFLWAEALGATPAWLPGFQWDVWSK